MAEDFAPQQNQLMRSGHIATEKLLQERIQILEQETASLRSALKQSQASEERYRQLFENDPIHKLPQQEQAAQERANLLNTTAQVANLLLRSPDYTSVLPDVVRLLGEAVGSDRCSIVQNCIDPATGQPGVIVPVEWCAAEIPTSVQTTIELQTVLLWEALGDFYPRFLQGDVFNFLVADLPEPCRRIFQSQGNTSVLAVPIVVNSRSWGLISFDNCGEPQLYDEAEIAILKIAADSLAAAIERQQNQEALLETEQNRAAELEKINEVLQRTIAQLATNPDLNAYLAQVMIEAAIQVEAANTALFLYEETSNTLSMHLFTLAGTV